MRDNGMRKTRRSRRGNRISLIVLCIGAIAGGIAVSWALTVLGNLFVCWLLDGQFSIKKATALWFAGTVLAAILTVWKWWIGGSKKP